MLVDNYVFFEPYIDSVPNGVRTLPLLEIYANNNSKVFEDATKDFDIQWNLGISYNKYKQQEKEYEKRFYDYLKLLRS